MTKETETPSGQKDEAVEEKKGSDEQVVTKDSGKPEYGSLEEAMTEIEKLRSIKTELIGERDKVKTKLRTIETAAEKKIAAELEEQGKFKELLEEERQKRAELESTIRTSTVVGELTKALSSEKVLSVDTVLALVDQSLVKTDDAGNISAESVADAIAKVKEQHGVLFGVKAPAKAPTSKRAAEDAPTGGYAEELKKLRLNPNTTARDLDNLRQKHGKK